MMKISHRVITVSATFLSGAGWPVVVGSLIGSTLPDIDLTVGIPHRTMTHWFPLPLSICAASLILPSASGDPHRIFNDILLGIGIGAILHIVEDSLTQGGVPLATPMGKRFSFRLTKTGGQLERIIVLVLIPLTMIKALTLPPVMGSIAEIFPHAGAVLGRMASALPLLRGGA